MLTEERKQIITEKVFEILNHNGLNGEEIRGLFKPDGSEDSGSRATLAAEQIKALFIAEQLTVIEVVNVFQRITGKLS